MAVDAPQRHYRAPCPGCGAPVEFRSAQSTHAVCGYCQSTVVRSGEVLRRIGKMAELFDDHSPLQLMASGRIALEGRQLPFTLIGRLQFQSDAGRWTEWVAFLEDGSRATLGEDNGAYVFTRPMAPGRELPGAERFHAGATVTLQGKPYSVAFAGQAQLLSAQGELPKLPPLNQPFDLVELRSADGEVLSIDYGHAPPLLERGRAVLLDDLQLQGLKDESAKDEQARQFNCPHCGAPVTVQLASTRSCTCPACASLIELGSGVGGELHAATQDEPVQPLIPLGSRGQLQGVHWQVVGFQHRLGQEAGDDESFGWSEYLLYNRQRGFAFVVDAEDGWSLVRPTTGAPAYQPGDNTATYLGKKYRLSSRYRARTGYVLGEFYWPVQRDQVSENTDFAAERGAGLLSREYAAGEVTWSSGDKIASEAVAQAFGLQDKAEMMKRQDIGPFVASSPGGMFKLILAIFVVVLIISLITDCSQSSGSYSRSSGGSFGGYSSGGSHK